MAATTLLCAAFVAATLVCAPRAHAATSASRPSPRAARRHAPAADSAARVPPVAPARPHTPTLLVPPRTGAAPDTAPESEPAPLIIPGQAAPADSVHHKSAAQRAREEFELGRALEGHGQPAGAMAAYRTAVLFDSTISDASYRMGLLYLGHNQVREAARSFAAEVRRHPEHTDADRELGLAYARLGNPKRGIARLERLTRLHPGDDESWRALAFAYSSEKRPRDAEAALKRAIRIGPRRAAEHRDFGALLAAQGRESEARDEYRRALAVDSTDATVWYDLGNLERRGGNLEAALRDYHQAERRDSSFALAIQGQVQAEIQTGHPKEAGEIYRRWLRSRPDDHNARLEAVRLFDQLDRHDIALELARDGVRRSPESGDAYTILGMALAAGGAARGALVAMRQAETLFRQQEERDKVEVLIAALRASAPDSLRALFDADSVAHARKVEFRPPFR